MTENEVKKKKGNLFFPSQLEKLGEKYVLTLFLDIHNNSWV